LFPGRTARAGTLYHDLIQEGRLTSLHSSLLLLLLLKVGRGLGWSLRQAEVDVGREGGQ